MAHIVHYIDRPRSCDKAMKEICGCIDCIYSIKKENGNWILDLYARPYNMVFIEHAIAAFM